MAVYAILFVLLKDWLGPAVQVFALIPSIIAGWVLGPWAGSLVGLLCFPFSGVLAGIAGFEGWFSRVLTDTPGHWMIYPGTIMMGWFSGVYFQAVKYRQILIKELKQKQASQDVLQESEVRYRTLVEQAGEVVFLTDTQGNFEYINPLGQQLTGYTMETLSQMHFSALISPDWLEKVIDFYENQIQEGLQESTFEYMLITKDGDPRWVEQTLKLRMQEGEIIGFQGILRDITARHHAQITLTKAIDEAQAANEIKSRLLATITHDVRTPLGAILGYADLLSSGAFGPITEEQNNTIKRIIISTQQVSNLVNNMLNMSEIESGDIGLANQSFKPDELLKLAKNLLSLFADDKNIELKFVTEKDLPEILMGDFQRVQQILINLVSNAIKYTDQGSVVVRLFKKSISHWGMEIKDTGPGIPAKDQEKIYVPFQKTEHLNNLKVDSTGLGLSIVKEYVDIMGGEIILESEIGKGSTFTVILPILPAHEAIKAD